MVKKFDNDALADLLNSIEEDATLNPIPTIKEAANEAQEPAEEAEDITSSIDNLAKELGIDLSGVEKGIVTPPPAPKEEKKGRSKREPKAKVVKEKVVKEPKAKVVKEPKTKVEKKKAEPKQPKAKVEGTPEKPSEGGTEKESKLTRVQVKMDAPIPVVKFKDLVIGYYGNILEPLPEPDKDGYQWKEVPKQKYHPAEQELYRSKGRMVLVVHTEGSRYLVGVEVGETFEGIIEVSNKGRGSLRCRQLAQALEVAYSEKADELVVDKDKYAELLEKTPKPQLNVGA